MAEICAFARKLLSSLLFVATFALLPFWALAPTYEIAYLVADEEAAANGLVIVVATPIKPSMPVMPEETEPISPVVAETALPVGGAPLKTHVVRNGETLSCVATRYRLSVSQLRAINNLSNPHLIRPGQVLRLTAEAPPPRRHRVNNGENLWVIAGRFRVTVSSLIEANNLANPDQLRIGQVLSIPSAAAAATPMPSRSSRSAGMIWPVVGRVTSPFGPRWGGMHTGLDIGAPTGTQIKAVRAGRVVQAGWWGGYGKSVMIDHGDGLMTLYAHASRVLVELGDRVVQGEVIAKIGSTGISTGPHLHFEVRVNDDFRDPLNFLPDQ